MYWGFAGHAHVVRFNVTKGVMVPQIGVALIRAVSLCFPFNFHDFLFTIDFQYLGFSRFSLTLTKYYRFAVHFVQIYIQLILKEALIGFEGLKHLFMFRIINCNTVIEILLILSKNY